MEEGIRSSDSYFWEYDINPRKDDEKVLYIFIETNMMILKPMLNTFFENDWLLAFPQVIHSDIRKSNEFH